MDATFIKALTNVKIIKSYTIKVGFIVAVN